MDSRQTDDYIHYIWTVVFHRECDRFQQFFLNHGLDKSTLVENFESQTSVCIITSDYSGLSMPIQPAIAIPILNQWWKLIFSPETVGTEFHKANPTLNEVDSSVSLFFLWITIFSIISLALVKILQKLGKSNIKGWSIIPNSQVPCRNCRFFDKNEYLQCAVNPGAVLTKQANNCSDYCNKDEASFQVDSQS